MDPTRIFHRLRQFRDVFFFRPLPDDYQAAEELLSPKLYKLFKSLPSAEQRHGFFIYQRLASLGYTDTSLLTAALLHDAGKARYPLRLWERVWVVLAHHYLPNLAGRWSSDKPVGLKRALVVAARHAEWGAQMTAEHGADPLVVEVIRQHQDKRAFDKNNRVDQLVEILQAVDDNY
jgi:putative nucleotidyltransferase with HDIG domain